MVAGIIILLDKFAIERGRNFSLVRGSLCCGFGIIRFARNPTASCKRSGLRCRRGARPIPHLDPLPLPKGDASFGFGAAIVDSRWNRQTAREQMLAGAQPLHFHWLTKRKRQRGELI